MAGSGFPPLTNIPYCCLPQESGPCLSTSVGDRPLRSPSHRRLGGPSPRRPSNGTHARPRPRRRLAREGMPLLGFIPYYPAFPPAIRKTGVGCIRVTHPSATLAAPKGRLPSDLHVLGLPLAFILSQDQTLRCSIVVLLVFSSESRVPPYSDRNAPAHGRSWFSLPYPCRHPLKDASVLASDFQRSLAKLPSVFPLSVVCGCKSTTFSQTDNDFFRKFLLMNYNTLTINEKNFTSCTFYCFTHTLY